MKKILFICTQIQSKKEKKNQKWKRTSKTALKGELFSRLPNYFDNQQNEILKQNKKLLDEYHFIRGPFKKTN